MHGRASVHLVEGQGDLRGGRAVRAGPLQRPDVFAGTGQQLLHLPGGRNGDLRDPSLSGTDELFIEAASAVADQVPSELLKQGLLYPLQSNILETEIQTAARVAKLIFDSGLARVERPADMVAFIRSHVYKPEYSAIPATKATKEAA